MKVIELKTCPSGPAPPENPRTLEVEWGTVEAARETLERLTEAFAEGRISEGQTRALVYAFNALLGFYKFEKDIEIEKRLIILEEKIYGKSKS